MHILSVWFSLSTCFSEVISMSCGIDNAPRYVSYEGADRLENYPWLGILYYPRNKKRYTTAVVLVTRQLVLASALEIDKLPKHDFRARARVIVGKSCNDELGVGIRGYTYHPDYTKSTYSAIALVQLDVSHVKTDLRPICPPPMSVNFFEEHFYAMVLSDDCKQSVVTIHQMLYVPPNECQTYYKEAGLDIASMWPAYPACAKSTTGGNCVWRSGAILVVKVDENWGLLGFGVHGPGCEAPARFVDYNMYHEWVQQSVERIGRPAITRVAENYLVLRRSHSTLQKFGVCNEEEMQTEYYYELGYINYEAGISSKAKVNNYNFNLTVLDAVEYTCVTLRAHYITNDSQPTLWLRRGDSESSREDLCTPGSQFIKIQFHMEIQFNQSLQYEIRMYGNPVKVIDPSEAHKRSNEKGKCPEVLSFDLYSKHFANFTKDKNYPLLGKKKMKPIKYATVIDSTVAPTKFAPKKKGTRVHYEEETTTVTPPATPTTVAPPDKATRVEYEGETTTDAPLVILTTVAPPDKATTEKYEEETTKVAPHRVWAVDWI